MNVKIPFLFIILILCITFSSFSREVNVTATKIKQFKHTVVSIEGNANAIKDSVISSEVVGVVSNIYSNEGDSIEKNQIIAKIDNSKYLAIYNSSQEKLFSIESELKKSTSRLKRYNGLLEKEIISNQEYEDVLYNHNSILSNFNSQLELMNFNKINLQNCDIKANFSGTISKKFIKLGQYIEEGDSLFEIIDSKQLEIYLYIPKIYYSLVKIDDDVEIVLQNGRKIEAKISNIVKKIDKSFGTFLAKVYLENIYGIIPGEDIVANIKMGSPKGSFLINKDSVINKGNKKIIFKVKNRRAIPVEIKIFDLYGDYFIAKGPINMNDLIVLDGNEMLSTNQKVNISEVVK
tara:strand:- start:9217 stop:10260 length:1044 start_codon:yes stop_codon:yes gene_type:complete